MGLVTKAGFRGKVEALYSRPSREDGFQKPATGSLNLLFSGPEGDCHAGINRDSDTRTIPVYKRYTPIRNVRQVTLVSVEELTEVANAMDLPAIDPTWLGTNFLVSGIPDFTLLTPSTRLQFPSGATLVVDMENAPCRQVADVIAKHVGEKGWNFVKAATGKRGVTAWVECEGSVNLGDPVTVWLPPQRIYGHS